MSSNLIPQDGSRGKALLTLVSLGDSTPTGYGVGIEKSYVQILSNLIHQNLGTEMSVRNRATNELRKVADWLNLVREDPVIRDDINQADIVTIWMGWHDLIPMIGVPMGGPCYPESKLVDLKCLERATSPMKTAFDNLLSQIRGLSREHLMILIADLGIPPLFVENWKADATFKPLKHHAYDVWRKIILQAADQNQAIVVNTSYLLNGPHRDQPMASEYIQPDGLHLNEKGHWLIAKKHWEVAKENLKNTLKKYEI